jgi:hypothetical protein
VLFEVEEYCIELVIQTKNYYKKKQLRPPSKKKKREKKPKPEEQEGMPRHQHCPPEKRRGDRNSECHLKIRIVPNSYLCTILVRYRAATTSVVGK